MIRKTFKTLQLVMHIFYGIGVIIYHTLIKRRDAHDPIFKEAFTHWYKQGCDIVGLRIVVQGEPAEGPVLMVSNHVSWLDILLLASVANPRFLSKAEVRQWPLVGWAGQQIDTLFIKRGERSASEAASAGIAEGLENGNRILIFPEGTTTEGTEVKRLHARLLGAAINTGSPVQPIVIHYTDDTDDLHTSDRIHFVGSQNLLTNLWLLLDSKHATAYVYCLPTIDSTGLTRKALSNQLNEVMQQTLEASQQAQTLRVAQRQNPQIH